MKYFYLKTCLFLSLLCLNFLVQAQESKERLPLPSQCVTGTLSNGLRYIIHPNSYPEKKVELRLVLAVGAQWEEAHERGMSHFLEHMAFTGSDDFPGRSFITTMEAMGIKYGYDLNAFTGYDRTIYELPTPTDLPENVGISLDILRSVLSGLHLHPADITKEQKIVLQEIKDAQILDPFDAIKKSDSRFANASVLGSDQEVLSINSAALRDYYDRWYRPDRVVLIAVGDLDTGEMEKAIKQRFGNLTARKTAHNIVKDCSLPLNGGVVYDQFADSLMSSDHLDLIFPIRSNEGMRFEDLRTDLKNQLFSVLINKRLASDTLLSCNYSRTWYLSDIDHAGFDITAKSPQFILQQIQRLASLLKQMQRFGFSKEELSDAQQTLLKRMEGASSGKKMSRTYCDEYISFALTGEVPIENDLRRQYFMTKLPTIESNELEAMVADIIRAGRRIIACYRYRPSHSSGCDAHKISQAWDMGLKASIEPYRYTPSPKTKNDDRVHSIDLRTGQLPASHIVSKKVFPSIHLTEYTLSNGLRLAVRPVSEGDSTVMISLFGKGGFSVLPPGAYPFFDATAAYIDDANIDGYTSDQIGEYIYENNLSLSTNISNYYHELYGAAFNGDVESLIKLLYLKVTATSLEEGIHEEILQQMDEDSGTETLLEKQLKASPGRVLDDLLADYSGVIHRERRELARDEFAQFSIDSINIFFRQLFTSPQQLVAVVSGAFDPDQTLPLLVRYLGAIPVFSTEAKQIRDIGSHFPKGIVRKEIKDPDADRSAVTIAFNGSYKHSLKQSLVFKMMRDVMQARLLDILREQEGKTYSPFANVSYSIDPTPRYVFTLHYECDDEDAEYLEKSLLSQLSVLKERSITQSELDNMKRSFLINKREHLNETNTSEWRNKIKEMYLECGSMEDFASYDQVLESITPNDILRGFNSCLSFEQYTVFTIKK